MGKEGESKIPDVYLGERYAWEKIFRTRISRRILIKGVAATLAIPAAALVDSIAQGFKVKPQDTIPMQIPIQLARKVKREVGKLAGRRS